MNYKSIESIAVRWGSFLLLLIPVGFGSMIQPAMGASATPVTIQSLLDEMVDVDSVARWPQPGFTVRQASSYDRARTAPDKPGWFSNHDGSNFIRTESRAGHEEHVMLDTDGPGAIVRFFTVSDEARTGRLRLYLDGAEEPSIEWPSTDLLSSDLKIAKPLCSRHAATRGHGGSTLYLPIPYARHCKVTLEEIDPAHSGGRFYHLDYRTYAAGTKVETFCRAALEAARPSMDRINQLLESPTAMPTTAQTGINETLSGGEEKSIDLPPGPAAVRQLELSVAADLPPAAREQALRSVVLRASFDGEPETIWCPAGDFIGSGAGGRPLASWYRTVDEQGNSMSRWTMPYRERARFTLQNLGTFAVAVKLTAHTAPWAWDDRSMYFHCNWHQQVQIPVRPFRDWNFITMSGRGVMVGDVMSVFNPEPSWYGEGNEKIWVDGESFPSHLGTGTEDYYNSSFAPNPLYQTPFANHPRMDETRGQGQNVYTRSRNLDTVPFEKSLQFDFEIETWEENYNVDYAATTYWYGSPGAHCNLPPELDEARRPVPAKPAMMTIQGAIECESLHVVNRTSGVGVERQDQRPFKGKWSGDAQLLIRGKKAGDFVEVAIPADTAAPRRITLYATAANDYGILKFSVNGQAVADTFDGYAPEPTPSAPITLGVFTPKDGKLILHVELVGSNPKSIGAKCLAGLDAVIVSEN